MSAADQAAAEDERGSRLAHLLGNGRAEQWSLESALDWRCSPRLPWWLPRRAYTTLVTQVYYGESATLLLCKALRPHLHRPIERALIDLQETDERRHTAAYERYLARLGDLVPPDEATTATLETGLAWKDDPLAMMVAFHVVLESEALTIQQDLSAHSPCPLFAALNARAARDEARHVAFGKLYLRGRLACLPREERHDIYRRVRRLWRGCAYAIRARYTGISARFFVLSRGRMDERWDRHARALVDLGLVDEADAARIE